MKIFHSKVDFTFASECCKMKCSARPLIKDGSLSCHTRCDTGPRFYGLVRGTAPCSDLGCWGLHGMVLVNFYNTQMPLGIILYPESSNDIQLVNQNNFHIHLVTYLYMQVLFYIEIILRKKLYLKIVCVSKLNVILTYSKYRLVCTHLTGTLQDHQWCFIIIRISLLNSFFKYMTCVCPNVACYFSVRSHQTFWTWNSIHKWNRKKNHLKIHVILLKLIM